MFWKIIAYNKIKAAELFASSANKTSIRMKDDGQMKNVPNKIEYILLASDKIYP